MSTPNPHLCICPVQKQAVELAMCTITGAVGTVTTFRVISGCITISWQFWNMRYRSESLYEIFFYSQSSTNSGSSTSFSFRNVTPDDTKPYIMRVVVKPSTAESMRSTIKRRIWIPGMKLRIVQALCAGMQIMWNVDSNTVEIILATLACSHTGMQYRWYIPYLGIYCNCCKK